MDFLADLVGEVKPHPVFFVGIGYFDTLVVSKYGAGLSSTLRPNINEHKSVKDAGHLTEKTLKDLAEYIFSDNTLMVSIGMAAINASLPLPTHFETKNAKDIIIEKGRGKKVGIIGHFPFVDEIKKTASTLYIFEQHPGIGDLPSSRIPEFLPLCDVVAITGMSIMNRSFEYIVEHTKKDAYKIVLGPSTPLSSRLFDFDIDAISGTIVEDPEKTKAYILEGAPFRNIKGIKLITMFKDHA